MTLSLINNHRLTLRRIYLGLAKYLFIAIIIPLVCACQRQQRIDLLDLPARVIINKRMLINDYYPCSIPGWWGLKAQQRAKDKKFVTFRWATGPRSEFRFFIPEVADTILNFMVKPFKSDEVEKHETTLYVNGTQVWKAKLALPPQDFNVVVPANLLKKGWNLGTFINSQYAEQELPFSLCIYKLKVLKNQIVSKKDNIFLPPEYLYHFTSHAMKNTAATDEWKKVLFIPNGEARYKIRLPKRPVLKAGYGVASFSYPDLLGKVLFEISLEFQGERKTLFLKALDPKSQPNDKGWHDLEIDLSQWRNREVELIFNCNKSFPVIKTLPISGFSEIIVESATQKKKGFDIILILVDTLRSDYLGCYGRKNIFTPTIDSLAKESVLFRNSFSHTNRTVPSITSIFTCRYVSEHGVISNAKPDKEFDLKTMADFLDEKGYKTAAAVSCKDLNFLQSPWSQSFDNYFDIMLQHDNANVADAEDTSKNVFKFLDRQREQNFFLFLHYFDPHTEYDPPHESYKKMYAENTPNTLGPSILETNEFLKKHYAHVKSWQIWLGNVTNINYPETQYRGEISYLDDQLKLLFDKLKADNRYDDTMIILTSDHGESLGEHGIYFCHEGQWIPTIVVPLIIKLPKRMAKSFTSQALVYNVDILPTILDYLNVDLSELASYNFRGKSLRPIIQGRTKEVHDYLYIETAMLVDSGIVDKKWQYIEHENHHGMYNFTTWLSHLRKDPMAAENCAPDNKKVSDYYHNILGEVKKSLPSEKTDPRLEMDEEKIKGLRSLGYI